MYKKLNAAGFRSILGVADDYRVDGLLVTGTGLQPKEAEHERLTTALTELGIPYTIERMGNRFYRDVLVINIGGKRLWYDITYGAAYLSQLAHMACVLGSPQNILLGSCGALQKGMHTNDLVIPIASYGNESATRLYQPENTTFIYPSDNGLHNRIKTQLGSCGVIHEGVSVTVQALYAETDEIIAEWSKAGYGSVDMETATFFAVCNHFDKPAAALLQVFDNLIEDQSMYATSEVVLAAMQQRRIANYKVAIQTLME